MSQGPDPTVRPPLPAEPPSAEQGLSGQGPQVTVCPVAPTASDTTPGQHALWALRLCPPTNLRQSPQSGPPAPARGRDWGLSSPLGAQRQGPRGLGPPPSTFGTRAASPPAPRQHRTRSHSRNRCGVLPKTPALPTGLSSLLGLGTHGSRGLQQSRAGQLPTHRPGLPRSGSGGPSLLNGPGQPPMCCASLIPTRPPGGCSRGGGAMAGLPLLSREARGEQGLRAAALVPAPSGPPRCRAALQVAAPGGWPWMRRLSSPVHRGGLAG